MTGAVLLSVIARKAAEPNVSGALATLAHGNDML